MYNLNYIKNELSQILCGIYSKESQKRAILKTAQRIIDAAERAETEGVEALRDRLNVNECDDISLLFGYFLEKVVNGEDLMMIAECMTNVFLVGKYALTDVDLVRFYMICTGLLAIRNGESREAVYLLMESLIPYYLWGDFYDLMHEEDDPFSEFMAEEEAEGNGEGTKLYRGQDPRTFPEIDEEKILNPPGTEELPFPELETAEKANGQNDCGSVLSAMAHEF